MICKRMLCGLALLLPVSGCIHVNHNLGDERWFNASLPIHLQHTLYQQERAFCAQAADRWQPIPDVYFSFNGVRHINGAPNVSVEGDSNDTPDTSLLSRRRLLRAMGVSSAGVVAAGAIAASREKITEAGDTANEELAELKNQFDALDKRSKLILRLVLVLSGLDLFLAI